VSGVDLDIGIGYDLYRDQRGYFGIGVVTGLSTPFMEMKNYLEAADYINTLLEDTSTDVETYKFGVTVQMAYNLAEIFSVYATGIYAMQTGNISNELVSGDFDVTGTYASFDVGVKYYLTNLSGDESDFYAKLGYTYKHWVVDDIDGSIGGFIMPNILTNAEIDMTSDYVYIGIGYNF
jgi:hypothetical protein